MASAIRLKGDILVADPPAGRREAAATPTASAASSIALAHVFNAHSLRWRCARVADAGDDASGSRGCNAAVEAASFGGDSPSHARLWTTDDLHWLEAPPGPDGSHSLPTDLRSPRPTDLRSPLPTDLRSHPPTHPHSESPPTEIGSAGAVTPPPDAAAAAAAERQRGAPFLRHELMGMEQLTHVVRGGYCWQYTCTKDGEYPSLKDQCDVLPAPLSDPREVHTRLGQLLQRTGKRVTAVHFPAADARQLTILGTIARSCPGLQALYLQVPPGYTWCPLHERAFEPTHWAFKEQALLEPVRQLVTGCPQLQSLHLCLSDNKYLIVTQELAALLSGLSHLSLPLFNLPPYLLPRLSSLRSLRLSLSASDHPLLVAGRPFHSLPLLSLLHLSLGTPANRISEPLSPDLFAGLGPSLRALTFLVHARQKGPSRKKESRCDSRVNGGGSGEDGGSGGASTEGVNIGAGGEEGMGESGGAIVEEECGERVEEEWGREDEVVCWVPDSLWELTHLQQLTTNVGGGWHGTGLNTLFPPHASSGLAPCSSSCCCSSSASSFTHSSRLYRKQKHLHPQCLASLVHLTSLSLLSHRTFPSCLSSLSSLTHLSIPLASPLLSPYSLSLFTHCSRLSYLHVCGEGPSSPSVCPTNPASAATQPPTALTSHHPKERPSLSSIRHLTLTGTAGVIPLAVWGSLCPQLRSLKVQGSPYVLLQGWGEGSERVGTCGKGEKWFEAGAAGAGAGGGSGAGADAGGGSGAGAGAGGGSGAGAGGGSGAGAGAGGGSGDGGGGASSAGAVSFFPCLEELVLRHSFNHEPHTQSHPLKSHSLESQQQQAHTLAFMGLLPNLTHLAIQNAPSPSHPHRGAPTLVPSLLPNLAFLRVHSPPHSPLPVLPKLRTLIVGSYPHSSLFLSSLSSFPCLSSLRIFHLSMRHYQSALSCPPSLKSLQICHSDVPFLPDSLHCFSSLTRLDLFLCKPLHALPLFLSSFSSLAHFTFARLNHMPVLVPPTLDSYLEGRRWAQEEEGGMDGEGNGEVRRGTRRASERKKAKERERRRRLQRVLAWSELSGKRKEEQREWVEKEEKDGGWKWWAEDSEGEVEKEQERGWVLEPPHDVPVNRPITHWRLPASVLHNVQNGKISSDTVHSSTAHSSSTAQSMQVTQIPAEVLESVLQRLHCPGDQARVRGVCREWRHWCRLHTSSLSFAFHPLYLAWVPLPLLQSPHSSSSTWPSSRSQHEYQKLAASTASPLPSSLWHPAASPLWVIHSSSSTRSFSLLPSPPPPLAQPTPHSSLSSCFTHRLVSWKPLAPVWFPFLPSPSSLAHTITLYPNLSALLLPLVSTPACPLLPAHLASLLATAAAQAGLTSLALLLEEGLSRDCGSGRYGREELWTLPWKEREAEESRWWVDANRAVGRGLLVLLQRCGRLKELHLQGSNLTDKLKLPHSLFHSCPQLTSLSLPISLLPSSVLHLSHLTSLSLTLRQKHMPPVFSHPAPFAHLRSLRCLSIHSSWGADSLDSSTWSVSDGLLLGLPALTSLSLHFAAPAMPDSFSSLSALSHLSTSLWIPAMEEEEEERGDEGEEGEEEGEHGDVCSSSETHTAADSTSGIMDEILFPLRNLTSLSLSHSSLISPLARHLTRLTSLSLPCMNHALSRLTRLEDLHIGCSNSCALPRLPRLRRCVVQCGDERVNITRFLANVASCLEELHVHADYRNYSSGNIFGAPVFASLKVLSLVTSGPASVVEMSLLPALEHLACAGNRRIEWQALNGFSRNLRFLHLDYAKISGYWPDKQLTQLTSVTTLVVDHADCRDFLACLSSFSSLRTLRLSHLTRRLCEPYLTCPPLLSTLQICFCDLPCLPPSLSAFSRLTHLDLLHWNCLHALPPFLSSFTSLRHFRVACDGPKPRVPACLSGFLGNREWYEHSLLDSVKEH